MTKLFSASSGIVIFFAIFATPVFAQLTVVHAPSLDSSRQTYLSLIKTFSEKEISELEPFEFKKISQVIDVVLPRLADFLGLSRKRPFGAYTTISDLMRTPKEIVLFLPYDCEEALLGLLKIAEATPLSDTDVYEVSTPDGDKFYLRLDNGYIYGALHEALISGQLPDIESIIGGQQADADITITFQCKPILPQLKELIVEKAMARVDPLLFGKPWALADGQRKNVGAIRRSIKRGIENIVLDSNSISVGVGFNEADNSLILQANLVAEAKTDLAAIFTRFSEMRSQFQNVVKGSDMHLLLHFPVSAGIKNTFSTAMASYLDGIDEGEDVEQVMRSRRLLHLYGKPEFSVADLCFAKSEPMKNGEFGIFFGLVLPGDISQFERELRDQEKDRSRDAALITFDFEKYKGVSIHRSKTLPILPGHARRYLEAFGGTLAPQYGTTYLAFVDNLLLLGVEKNGLALLRTAIARMQSADQHAAKMPPVQFEFPVFELERRSKTGRLDQIELAKMIERSRLFGTPLKDKLRMSIFADRSTLGFRVVVEENILRLILKSFDRERHRRNDLFAD